ncbi:MAG TPA: hypothetical protein VF550_17035 [Polyangia bacterium]
MRVRIFNLIAWSMGGLFCLACSGKSPDNGGLVHLDGPAGAADAAPLGSTFAVFNLPECGLAGYQTVASASGSKVAFASLATTSKTAPCANSAAPTPLYDICVVLPTATGFAGSIATSQPYLATMGVGITLDKSGEPVLAYTGGPAASMRCGASDMLMASVSGGKLGAPITIAADSKSTGMPADQKVSCAAQDVCNQGDATGYWPSIARDPLSGALAVAFRDLHFGAADTDFASSDVEFALGDAYAVYTVDVARGGGTYNRLAFSPTGKAAVAHYSLDYQPAVWLDWQNAQGWSSQKLFTGKIREHLGFAISAQGLYALAYYDDVNKLLMYRDSTDGSTWNAAENVDRDGVTGYHPSLAFDDQGNPAIAYYRCGDYGVADGCDKSKDGLILAIRRQGTWEARKVVGDSGSYDGLYSALAFVGGKAVIAYQSNDYDPVARTSKVSLHIAQEM